MDARSWPAGHPDEVNIRAKLARSAEEVPCAPTIRRGDLAHLDEIISFFDAVGNFGLVELYDNAWNLRNHLVPFQPGDQHYDADCAADEDR